MDMFLSILESGGERDIDELSPALAQVGTEPRGVPDWYSNP